MRARFLVISLVAVALATSSAVANDAAEAAPREPSRATYQLALLVSGPDRTPLGEREIQALQEAYLDYVREEIERGTIVLAGRVHAHGDPSAAVLLAVASADEARAILERHPWVRAGRVRPELAGWHTDGGVLGRADGVIRTERCYLALYRRPDAARTYPPETMAELEAGHRDAVVRLADGGDVVLHGKTTGDTPIREIVLLRAADMDRIREALAGDPYLTMGLAGFELYPWHVPRGALPRNDGSSRAGL